MLEKIFYKGIKRLFPSEIKEGQVLYAEDENGLYLDNENTRDRLNPPADWEETDQNSPSYIANRPEIYNILQHKLSYTIIADEYVSHINGTTGSSQMLSRTDYIDISDYSFILYKRAQTTYSNVASGVALYDTSKAYISGISLKDGQSEIKYVDGLQRIILPDNAVYVRFSVLSDASTYGDFNAYGCSFTGIDNVLQDMQSDLDETIKYTTQNLNEEQKNQVKVNIGSTSSSAIADEFSTSSAYAIGDLVMYESKLYKFNTAHTAGDWNSAQVNAVSVDDELSDLRGDLQRLQEVVNTLTQSQT